MTELHYPDEPQAALLLAWEAGYETWQLTNVIPLVELVSTEADRWETFRREIVPGLVEEAGTGKITKLIGIDTIDKCVDAATAWILLKTNKKYGKQFMGLQEIGDNTSENGWVLLYDELSTQFDKLRNAGYGLMYLAWTKEKETTLYDGRKYNAVELMMHNTARKVFESQASFICCLHNEVTLLDKAGNVLEENPKNKKGKEVGTKFHETQVYMYFRPSQYISIAGGRFINLPEKVAYSAKGYLEVFENAVKGQLSDPSKLKQIKEQQSSSRDIQVQRHAKQVVAQAVEEVHEKSPAVLVQEITDAIVGLEKAVKPRAAERIRSILGVTNALAYKQATDTEKLFACLHAIKSL
ncbi:MAG: hypothetical protein DDT31_01725 [Syntrophomonadaceae bacterium]|nr:hypothetical protein [Bacillota bacterium]